MVFFALLDSYTTICASPCIPSCMPSSFEMTQSMDDSKAAVCVNIKQPCQKLQSRRPHQDSLLVFNSNEKVGVWGKSGGKGEGGGGYETERKFQRI